MTDQTAGIESELSTYLVGSLEIYSNNLFIIYQLLVLFFIYQLAPYPFLLMPIVPRVEVLRCLTR